MSLQDIFEEQIRLNEKINPDLYKEIDDPEIKRQRFLQFELVLRQESAEAIDSLNWKWWREDDDDWKYKNRVSGYVAFLGIDVYDCWLGCR